MKPCNVWSTCDRAHACIRGSVDDVCSALRGLAQLMPMGF